MTVTGPNAQAPFSAKQGTDRAMDFSGKTALGKEDFLKLLVTQLANQDPLNPTDSTQFVAQLAQFSSLEQLANMREGLDMLAIVQTAGTSAQMVSFIGKTVKISDQSLTWAEGQKSGTVDFSLDGDAKNVKVAIKDESGKTVKTIEAGSLTGGKHSVTVDGKNSDGSPLPAGSYTFEVTATDVEGKSVNVSTTSTGVVVGVTFESGYPELVLADGRTVQLGSVIEVLDGPTTETAAKDSVNDLISKLPQEALDTEDLLPDNFRM
ncbi:MAG: basal-body rod modification protein FlgD [Myxococcales bacterium]